MEGQIILQKLDENKCRGLTREEAEKLLEYVKGLERGLANVLRSVYAPEEPNDDKNRPAA